MSDIPAFVKDSGESFDFDQQANKSPSDRVPPTCRVLKKSLLPNVWFISFFWPYADEVVTTTRIDICAAWIQLRNERDRLKAIHKACEEVNKRKIWNKDCKAEQVAEIKDLYETARWTFHPQTIFTDVNIPFWGATGAVAEELDRFVGFIDKYQSNSRIPLWLLIVPPDHSVLDLKDSPFRLKPKTKATELSTLPLLIVHHLWEILNYTRRVPEWYDDVRKLFPEGWRDTIGLPIIETDWMRWVMMEERQRALEAARGGGKALPAPPRKRSFLGINFQKSSSASSSTPAGQSVTPMSPPPTAMAGPSSHPYQTRQQSQMNVDPGLGHPPPYSPK